MNMTKASRHVVAAKSRIGHGSKKSNEGTCYAGGTFFAVSFALLASFAGRAFFCQFEGPIPILGNAGGVGPSSASHFARLRLLRTSQYVSAVRAHVP